MANIEKWRQTQVPAFRHTRQIAEISSTGPTVRIYRVYIEHLPEIEY
jgi:hypothetical protein